MADGDILTKATMSPDQRACHDLLCDAFRGEHHAPERIYRFGRGIKCNVPAGLLSTFDSDVLTRLVVLAHDRFIRIELKGSGPDRVGLAFHRRQGRDGNINERHPTIDEAVSRVREDWKPG